MSLQDEVTPEIKPGDDFYAYVNKKWMDAHPIPDDKSRIGAFIVLADENTERLRNLLDKPAAQDEPINIQKLRQYYQAAMDEAAIEAAGDEPLKPYFAEIDSIKDKPGLASYVTGWHAKGVRLIWSTGLDVDDKNSRRYVINLAQGGLGLPDRDYYLVDSPEFREVRQKYQDFLAETFKVFGFTQPEERAERVYALEEELAKVSASRVDRRDPDKMYNPFKVSELNGRFPALDWTAYFASLGVETEEVIISHPPFMEGVAELLDRPVEEWQDYLRIRASLRLMPKLAKRFDQLHFGFYGKVLSGAKEQEPRYRRIIKETQELMMEPMGQLYVSSYFGEEAKKEIYDLVGLIKESLRDHINGLAWMGAGTKQKALEKLDTFMPLLGYPDSWRDYSGLELAHDYTQNYLALHQMEWQYDAARLNKPVDRKEWLMSPAEVNAYYWANTNGITFPAGILQPPFFDAGGDFAANYGGIGVVIGHELTHGFDDQGSKFDKDGNLITWWTDEDRQKFDAVAQELKKQYDQYQVNGRNLNGQLTLGENIADLGGVAVAFDALQKKLAKDGVRDKIDGFTPEQRFFLSYARVWRKNIRPELALQFLVTDTHSPGEYRVNGVVTNIGAFYEAFEVEPEDKLYSEPEERVKIW